MNHLLHLIILYCLLQLASAFSYSSIRLHSHLSLSRSCWAKQHAQQSEKRNSLLWSAEKDDVDESVKKIGLEATLLKTATQKDAKVRPKDLLAKYGIAYLATSITLAIFSYALCYVLVANGVNVPSLLEKVGIKSTEMVSNTGTAAIAYAVHKAASPIRFPPTVVLTPVVARWFGKKDKSEGRESSP
eukprot:scaffold5082_cov195-Ochromonas_danica.AAC.3